jgi:hypothetical protein
MKTKKLSFQEMEGVEGGDLLDGACAGLALTGMGIGVKVLIGAKLALTGWGTLVIAGGAIACGGRALDLW